MYFFKYINTSVLFTYLLILLLLLPCFNCCFIEIAFSDVLYYLLRQGPSIIFLFPNFLTIFA